MPSISPAVQVKPGKSLVKLHTSHDITLRNNVQLFIHKPLLAEVAAISSQGMGLAGEGDK